MGIAFEPFSDDDDAMALSQRLGAHDPLVDRIDVVGDLGDQDRFGAACKPRPEGDEARFPPHDFDDVRPLMARRCIADLVDGVDGRVDGSVKSDGCVREGDIVVDGRGHPDCGDAHLESTRAPL